MTIASSREPVPQTSAVSPLTTLAEVIHAQRVLSATAVLYTPLLASWALSAETKAHVYVKAENLQVTRSFKIRGATYKLSRLTPAQRAKGVVTASRGNHAQAMAFAAKAVGCSALVVMPTDAEPIKVKATERLGAEVCLRGASMSEAANEARQIAHRTARTFVPAFDDPAIIAGQGTIGLEILGALPNVEAILVPVGGGGLISGIALAVKSLRPEVQIIGIQAKQMPAMIDSLKAGHPVTLKPTKTRGDGINVNSPSDLTLHLVRTYVDNIVEVDEDEMAHAMVTLLDACNLMVEGAGAVGVAALLHYKVSLAGKRVVAVLSGGNVDLAVLTDLRRALGVAR